MKSKEANKSEDDEAAFNRRFKYAVVTYAVVEFIVIAAVVCYQILND